MMLESPELTVGDALKEWQAYINAALTVLSSPSIKKANVAVVPALNTDTGASNWADFKDALSALGTTDKKGNSIVTNVDGSTLPSQAPLMCDGVTQALTTLDVPALHKAFATRLQSCYESIIAEDGLPSSCL
jgi:hypothetical protein